MWDLSKEKLKGAVTERASLKVDVPKIHKILGFISRLHLSMTLLGRFLGTYTSMEKENMCDQWVRG